MQVLERLHGSLLDYLVAAAGTPAGERLAALRKITHQLLVGGTMHAMRAIAVASVT